MLTSFTQKWRLLLSFALLMFAGQFLTAQSGIEVTGSAGIDGSYFGPPAFFSGEFAGQSGELVVPVDTSGNPEFGCYEFTNDLTGKIALIDRGGCGFAVKGVNAQNAGAIAAIVCTNNANPPFQMLGSPGLDIPVIMLSMADCDLIKTEMPGVTATMLAPNADETCVSGSTITDGTYTASDLDSGLGTVFTGATHGKWYKYTATSEGLLNINSCGGGSDTRLIVIPGDDCADASDNILAGNYFVSVDACDDGSGNNGASELNILTYAGTTYNIHWDNAQDSTGFDFSVNLGPLPTIDATFTVDMSNETVSGEGVYFNWADPATLIPQNQAMTDNGDGSWSTTLSLTALDTIGYFFSNGLPNDLAKFEVVPAACGVEVDVAGNIVYVRPYLAGLSPDPGIVCFGSCEPCPPPACANPDAIFCDDAEMYSLGSVSAQASFWAPWPGGESAVVTDEQAASGAQSIKVEGGGSVDQLLLLGDSTQGNYRLTWKFYIPSGNGGYFNYQKEEGNPGGEFGMQLDFAPDGTATLDATAPAIVTFDYPQDEWFDVVSFIDLDNDVIRLLVAGDVILEWPYSATTFDPAPSLKQLGSINFYPIDADYVFYIDDVEFVKLPPQICNPDAIICDGFEWYVEGSRTGPQAPYWSTWSGDLGGADDGLVTTEQAASGNNSMLIAEGQTQDVLLLLGNTMEGNYLLRWDMYIPAGKTGYFNIQEEETPGVQWNLEVYLNRDGNNPGVGELDGLGVTFNYTEDQWFSLEHFVDLDNNQFELLVDGVSVGVLDFTDNLGAINFFSVDADNRYYLDNVELIALPAIPGNLCSSANDLNPLLGQAVGEAQTSGLYNNTNYTTDPSDPTEGFECHFDGDSLAAPIWYTFTGDGETYLIRTVECNATDYIDFGDTQAAIYTGDCGNLTPVACAEDEDAGNDIYNINLEFETEAGVEYYMLIDGYDTSDGEFCVEMTRLTAQSINVTFNADAQLLIDNGTLDASGLWIAGSFNGFNGEQMTDNGDGTYSFTAELDPNTQYTYKFQNGQGGWENIDVTFGDDCVTGANNDRFVDVVDMDLDLPLVCFNYCVSCDEVVSIDEVSFQNALELFPNPAQNQAFVNYDLPQATDLNLQLVNNLGQIVQHIEVDGALNGTITLDLGNVPVGLYMLQITDGTNQYTEKLVVEK